MIKDLYYGNIDRSAQMPMSDKRRKLSHRITEITAKLKSVLTSEQNTLLSELLDAVGESSSYDCADTYEKGFCDGIELMLDYLSVNSKK